MTADTAISYPYKARPTIMIATIVFFGACAAVLAFMALGDDPNATRRLGGFTPETARILLWIMTAVSLGFVAIGLLAAIRSVTQPGQIDITPTELRAPPRPITSKQVTVPLNTVTGLDVQNVAGQVLLNIHHTGQKLVISQQALPKGVTVEDIAQALDQRINALT